MHWPALVAQALGTAASVLAFNQTFYAGPIARAFGGGGADFSVFTGVFVGGLAYLVLAGAGVRREADVQDRLLARSDQSGKRAAAERLSITPAHTPV